MKKIIVTLLVLTTILAACGGGVNNYDEFAKCLTTNGMTFYGAFWCPHCQNMKTEFGDSMKYIQYVECDTRGKNAQPQLCDEKKITGYPVFEFASGKRLQGEQPLLDLAVAGGCKLP